MLGGVERWNKSRCILCQLAKSGLGFASQSWFGNFYANSLLVFIFGLVFCLLLESFLEQTWVKKRTKIDQKSIENRSKIDQKSIKNRSKIDRKSSFCWTSNLDRFFIDFGNVFGANLGPCWGHVGAKLGSKSASKLDDFSSFVFHRFWKPLGIDFGAILRLNMGAKRVSKSEPSKSEKFDSRPHGSVVFKVSGASKIDRKSMKKRLQDKTST